MKEEQFLKKIDKLKQNILKKIHHIEKYETEIKELKTEVRLDQKILNKFNTEKEYGSTSQMTYRINQTEEKILKIKDKKENDKDFLDKIKLKLDNLVKESQEQSKV